MIRYYIINNQYEYLVLLYWFYYLYLVLLFWSLVLYFLKIFGIVFGSILVGFGVLVLNNAVKCIDCLMLLVYQFGWKFNQSFIQVYNQSTYHIEFTLYCEAKL